MEGVEKPAVERAGVAVFSIAAPLLRVAAGRRRPGWLCCPCKPSRHEDVAPLPLHSCPDPSEAVVVLLGAVSSLGLDPVRCSMFLRNRPSFCFSHFPGCVAPAFQLICCRGCVHFAHSHFCSPGSLLLLQRLHHRLVCGWGETAATGH